MYTNKLIPLIGGMDDSIGLSHHPEGVLRRLLNCKVNRTGEISKRNGFYPLTLDFFDNVSGQARKLNNIDGSSNPDYGRCLISGESQHPLLLTNRHLLSLSTGGWYNVSNSVTPESNDRHYRPHATGCSVNTHTVLRAVSDQNATQTVANSSYILTGWIECPAGINAFTSPRLYYSIYDRTNNKFIVDGVAPSSSDVTYFMPVANESYLALVWLEGANIKMRSINCATFVDTDYTLKTTAVNTVADAGSAAPLYVAESHTDEIVIGYRDTVADTTVFFSTYTGTVSGTTSYGSAGTGAIAIEYDSVSSRYVLVYCTAVNSVISKILNTSLVDQTLTITHGTIDALARAIRLTIGFNTVSPGISTSSVPNVYIAWELLPRTGINTVEIVYRFTANNTVYDSRPVYNATLCSTIFKYQDQLYVGLGYARSGVTDVSPQSSLFICAIGFDTFDGGAGAWKALSIAGSVLRGEVMGRMDNRQNDIYGPPCRVKNNIIGHRRRTKYVQGASNLFAYFSKSFFSVLDFDAAVTSETVDGITYIATGSILKQFDGYNVSETGFLLYPEVYDADIAVTVGAGGLSAGSYSWRIYYEYEYGGKRTRSYAMTISKTVAALDKVTITVPSLPFTQRENVIITAFRTEVNPTASSPFYRCTKVSPSASGSAFWYTNTFQAANVAVVDVLSDSSLAAETDYLYANEVPHIIPDMRGIAAYGNRLIGYNESTVYSSLLFERNDTVEFSTLLSIDINPAGGDITAAKSIGNNLLLFKNNTVFAFSGAGPDNLGVGTYSETYEGAHKVGCSDARLIDKLPGGCAFYGDDGLFVITEGLQIQDIGEPIANILLLLASSESISETVTRIVYNPTLDTLFVLVGGGLYSFAYNLNKRVWSVWSHHEDADVSDYHVHKGVNYILTDYPSVLYQGDAYSNIYSDYHYIADVITSGIYVYGFVTDYLAVSGNDPLTNGRVKSVMFICTGRNTTGTVTVSMDCDRGLLMTGSYNFSDIDSGELLYPQSIVNTNQPRFEYYCGNQRCSNVAFRVVSEDALEGFTYTHIALRVKESQNGAKMAPSET